MRRAAQPGVISQSPGTHSLYCPPGDDGNINTERRGKRTEPFVHDLVDDRSGVPDIQLCGSGQIASSFPVIASAESFNSRGVPGGELGS